MNLIISKNEMNAKKFRINKKILKQKFVKKGSNILNFKNKDKTNLYRVYIKLYRLYFENFEICFLNL